MKRPLLIVTAAVSLSAALVLGTPAGAQEDGTTRTSIPTETVPEVSLPSGGDVTPTVPQTAPPSEGDLKDPQTTATTAPAAPTEEPKFPVRDTATTAPPATAAGTDGGTTAGDLASQSGGTLPATGPSDATAPLVAGGFAALMAGALALLAQRRFAGR